MTLGSNTFSTTFHPGMATTAHYHTHHGGHHPLMFGPNAAGPPGSGPGCGGPMGPGHHHHHHPSQRHNQSFEEMVLDGEHEEAKCCSFTCGENYIHVDRFFLVAMPLLFLIFNIVYWFAYGSHFILNSLSDEVGNEVKITNID